MDRAGDRLPREVGTVDYTIANGLGDTEPQPTLATMGNYLEAVAQDDEDHGAAWVTDGHDNSLQYNSDGVLVFLQGWTPARHLSGISRERALLHWLQLIEGRLGELERLPWKPGLRPPLPSEELERQERLRADQQLHHDWAFFQSLGPECPRPGSSERCRRSGCPHGRIAASALCRAHHFESVRGRECPFDE
jgi:hypothetical protein